MIKPFVSTRKHQRRIIQHGIPLQLATIIHKKTYHANIYLFNIIIIIIIIMSFVGFQFVMC